MEGISYYNAASFQLGDPYVDTLMVIIIAFVAIGIGFFMGYTFVWKVQIGGKQ